MGRKPNIIPSHQVCVRLPEDVYLKLMLHLHSEVEGRVPVGALQRFFMERITEYFSPRDKGDSDVQS